MVMVHVHHNEGFVKMVCGRTVYRLAHLVDKSHHMVAEKEMVNYKEFKMEVVGGGGERVTIINLLYHTCH